MPARLSSRCVMDGQIPIRFQQFSTEDFPVHSRIGAYREIYGRTIVKHDIEPLGDEPFRFESTVYAMPGAGLASSLITPCRRWHGPQHIDGDDFVLGIGLAGGCVVRQSGREAAVGRGEAVLTATGRPAEVVILTTSRPLSLRLPGAVLRSNLPGIDDRIAKRIPQDRATLSLLKGYLTSLLGVDASATPALCDLIATHIQDLVALVLGAEGDTQMIAEQRGAGAARRAAILRHIGRRYADANLDVGAVASLLGVTPRYVHHLLEETGRSFSQHVLERRLQAAVALLRDPLWRDCKIAEIAAEAGFTDLSYFNRSFRRHFGATPSDMRSTTLHHE